MPSVFTLNASKAPSIRRPRCSFGAASISFRRWLTKRIASAQMAATMNAANPSPLVTYLMASNIGLETDFGGARVWSQWECGSECFDGEGEEVVVLDGDVINGEAGLGVDSWVSINVKRDA